MVSFQDMADMLFTSTQSMPLLYISLLSAIIVLYLSVKRRNLSKNSYSLIPHPPKLPIIGNLHQIGALYHQSLYFLSQKYGPVMMVRFGEVPWLIVSSSDTASAIMRTHDLAFASRPLAVVTEILRFRDVAFEPYTEDWRQLKKIFTIHLLSAKKVASYTTIRKYEVSKLIAKVNDHASLAGSEPMELSKVLFSFMVDIVCHVVSGKFNTEKRWNALIREIIVENFQIIGRFGFADIFPSMSWLEGFLGLSKRAERLKKKWSILYDEVIQAHIQSGEHKEKQANFVDIILSLKDDPAINFEITMDHIKGLLADTFAAGIDTTYVTLDWIMSELMKNPKIMKKLQDEVRGIVKHKDMVEAEDLNQMSYLKCVIKETLRLHPVLPLLLPRQSMEDCEINGFKIPKGTRVLINAWAIGREAKSWEAPEKFIPERFMHNQVDFKGNDFQFIPFGAGRRICSGITLATSTIELVVANLVHSFDWELPGGMTTKEFNMAEAPGLSVHRIDELKLIVKKVQASA